MIQKTIARTKPIFVERAYSKEKIERLKVLFIELVKFKDSPAIKAYSAKRRSELKG